ncbi:MAG: mechanosensitive ion channel family protein [Spirochaetales bacterium]|nr:mechanosensitive ion channel family protein [Spirochaetales bacterium]
MNLLLAELNLSERLSGEQLIGLLTGIVWFILGIIILKVFLFILKKTLKGKMADHPRKILQSVLFYTGVFLLLVIVLGNNGIDLSPLLGAAGIVGIAVGIASQASLSNIISGALLLFEKPFGIGDIVKVGAVSGIVESIGLMSVNIRTFDNLFVRIPSQQLFNSELTNVTRYQIRRLDLNFHVAVTQDLEVLQNILKTTARQNQHCLNNPEPLIVFTKIDASGLEILFGVWFYKTDYLAVKNSITAQTLKALAAEGIEVRYPRQHLEIENYTSPSASAKDNSSS